MTAVTVLGADLGDLEPPTDTHDPDWLTRLRGDAARWVHDHGLPAAGDEDWKYTPVQAFRDMSFQAASVDTATGVTPAAVEALVPDLGGSRLVFVNGVFMPEASRRPGLSDGANVTSLAVVRGHRDGRLRASMTPPDGSWNHAFSALNTALAVDGAFIDVAPDAIVDQPIHLVFVARPGAIPLMTNPRTIVVAGNRSQVTIVEHYVGMAGRTGCTNVVTDIDVGEQARVEHFRVQEEPGTISHLGALNVHQGKDSWFSSEAVTLGAGLARNEATIRLDAPGAQADLRELYLPSGDQTHVNVVLVEHAAPGTTSHQLYKGVIDGQGRGVFNGRVVVQPGADGTDATQTNRSLLLSDRAEADTRPQLEIYADDVKCAHGATVGQLDGDALFYLRSRGIPHSQARTMLIKAFADEIVDGIGPVRLRSWVAARVTERLRPDIPGVEGEERDASRGECGGDSDE